MNVVVIPCFNRPEFISICLELIQKAEQGDLLYLFQVDFGYDPQVVEVIERFPLKKEIKYTPSHTLQNKQSYSLLMGYENALQHNPDKIYLIEDDIFIANDFFIWHEKNIGNNFASIATKNHNAEIISTGDLAASYTMSEYQSLGVCFQKSSIEEILSGITEEYYKDPKRYLKNRFPNSPISIGYCEQDGLIRRIIQDKNHQVVFADVPRAFHAGYWGKSRGVKPSGILEERICEVRLTAFDTLIMKGDSEPVLLVNPIY